MRRTFDELKKTPRKIDNHLEGQATFDAAIQVLLEHANLPGVDKETDSTILLRKEKRDVLPKYKDGAKKDEVIDGNLTDAGFLSGVCESHGHITASMVTGDFLTVVRVPYSRVHSLWFMEREGITTSGDYVKRTDQPFDQGNFQFWAYHQNEIDACR